MKKILLNIFFLVSIVASGQNVVHTAFDTNGAMGECLFPSDSEGNVVYTGKVEVDSMKAQEISNALKNYIDDYVIKHKIGKDDESFTTNSIVCKLEYPVGKSLIGVEVWGSPVFSYARDASKVSFLMEIKIRDGVYKYKLSNFWTSRRMIHGEGKNDGPSNMIHWQRVNSLTMERDAYASNHNSSSRSVKEELYDYDAQINFEKILYQQEYNAISDFVNGLKSIKVKDDFDDFDSDVTVEKAKPTPLDLSSYKGNLLAKGNNVYIETSSKSYEMEGAYELCKQIEIDSYWKIVSSPELAHFTIRYCVDLEGRDHAYLFVKDRFGDEMKSGNLSTSESSGDNHEVARKLYLKWLYPKLLKLEKGRADFDLYLFNR